MSNYPRGDMRGSGIFARAARRTVMCAAPIEPDHDDENSPDECQFHDEVDVDIDDFGVGAWQCPDCGAEHEVERDDL